MLAASRLASLHRSAALSAINLILALWIIASPWVYGYFANVGAVKDNLILGIAIALRPLVQPQTHTPKRETSALS